MVDRTKETLEGAVATTYGWVDPESGELLVSIRGLPDAIEWDRKMSKDVLKAKADPKVAEAIKEEKAAEEKAEAIAAITKQIEGKKPTVKKSTKKAAE